MYVVTGVTGQTGSKVADYLLLKKLPVRVVVRDAKKGQIWKDKGAEVVVADLTDPVSLFLAFKNADAAYIVKPPSLFEGDCYLDAENIGQSVKEAVEKSNLKRIVVLSSIGSQLPKNVTGIIYSNTILENQLKTLKTPTIFLRASSFMENWKLAISMMPKTLVLNSFYPVDKSIPMVSTLDIGKTAAALMIDDWNQNEIIEIEGPHHYSPKDVAVAAGELLGIASQVKQIPDSEMKKVLSQMTPVAIDGYITMVKHIDKIVFEKDRPRVKGEVSLLNGIKEIIESGVKV